MAAGESRYGPAIASAVILVATVCGWLLMPRIMLAVSGGGPVVGALVAILFMVGFFAVLWLRARHQRRIGKD
jgi:hypothetical protein